MEKNDEKLKLKYRLPGIILLIAGVLIPLMIISRYGMTDFLKNPSYIYSMADVELTRYFWNFIIVIIITLTVLICIRSKADNKSAFTDIIISIVTSGIVLIIIYLIFGQILR